MSRRTIRVLDLLCDVGNRNHSLRNAFDDERPKWIKDRDRKLQTLKATVAALTGDDLDLIKRLYHPQRLAAQLREVGVAPRW
jgi:hypothetical protein